MNCTVSVHLENGQRVYFTKETAERVATEPGNTTLTAFFELCQNDSFAKTLLYSEVPNYYTWDVSEKDSIDENEECQWKDMMKYSKTIP